MTIHWATNSANEIKQIFFIILSTSLLCVPCILETMVLKNHGFSSHMVGLMPQVGGCMWSAGMPMSEEAMYV